VKRKGIASGGNLVVDFVKIVDSYPKQGTLSNISLYSRSTGGAVTNVLIDLAKIDGTLPLCAIGLVGCDDNGEYVIQRLREYGIDTGQVRKHDELGTSFTDVIAVQTAGERTFFHYRGANAAFSIGNIDFDNLNVDILHIGYALLLDTLDMEDEEYGTVMARLLAKAQKHGIKTSMDVVSENSDRFSKLVPPSLKYTDYCVVNEIEASMITEIPARDGNGRLIIDNIKQMCSRLFAMGVGKWTVIHSPEMGCGMDSDGSIYVQPSVDVPKEFIKGKVGAGDAFCAGILYAAYMKWSLEKALVTASATAACCLSEANTTDGMKPISEAMEIFEKYPKMDLK